LPLISCFLLSRIAQNRQNKYGQIASTLLLFSESKFEVGCDGVNNGTVDVDPEVIYLPHFIIQLVTNGIRVSSLFGEHDSLCQHFWKILVLA